MDAKIILPYFENINTDSPHDLNSLARDMLEDIYWLDAYSNYSRGYISKEVAIRRKIIHITMLLADKLKDVVH